MHLEMERFTVSLGTFYFTLNRAIIWPQKIQKIEIKWNKCCNQKDSKTHEIYNLI